MAESRMGYIDTVDDAKKPKVFERNGHIYADQALEWGFVDQIQGREPMKTEE